jgi:hypothetical protein
MNQSVPWRITSSFLFSSWRTSALRLAPIGDPLLFLNYLQGVSFWRRVKTVGRYLALPSDIFLQRLKFVTILKHFLCVQRRFSED